MSSLGASELALALCKLNQWLLSKWCTTTLLLSRRSLVGLRSLVRRPMLFCGPSSSRVTGVITTAAERRGMATLQLLLL